jgi:cobalt-zinc-cadmium efflux system protein
VHAHGNHGHHKKSLFAAFTLTALFLIVEAAVGLWTGSLSLLADATHMLVDAGGLLLSLGALWFAERPAPPEKTYGYYRVEILAALVNGVVLCLLAAGILVKAYERSVAVIVAGTVILLTGWVVADPIASAAIALFILPRTWSLLRQAVNVLLEAAPAHLNVAQIEAALVEAEGVRRVHDLHVWTLSSGREAMSAHVVVAPETQGDRILDALHVILHTRFGIDHTTIQIETEPSPLIQISPRA